MSRTITRWIEFESWRQLEDNKVVAYSTIYIEKPKNIFTYEIEIKMVENYSSEEKVIK